MDDHALSDEGFSRFARCSIPGREIARELMIRTKTRMHLFERILELKGLVELIFLVNALNRDVDFCSVMNIQIHFMMARYKAPP